MQRIIQFFGVVLPTGARAVFFTIRLQFRLPFQHCDWMKQWYFSNIQNNNFLPSVRIQNNSNRLLWGIANMSFKWYLHDNKITINRYTFSTFYIWTFDYQYKPQNLFIVILYLGGSPYPNINARQIAGKIQEGYRMPKPTHVDDKL